MSPVQCMVLVVLWSEILSIEFVIGFFFVSKLRFDFSRGEIVAIEGFTPEI